MKEIRPLIAGDARASARADAIGRRETRGKVLLYTELAFLVGCIALTPSDGLDPTTATYTGIGLCLGTIALGIAAVIVTPKHHHYGEPLKLYNESHPEAPYVAPKLGVKPPAPPAAVTSSVP